MANKLSAYPFRTIVCVYIYNVFYFYFLTIGVVYFSSIVQNLYILIFLFLVIKAPT